MSHASGNKYWSFSLASLRMDWLWSPRVQGFPKSLPAIAIKSIGAQLSSQSVSSHLARITWKPYTSTDGPCWQSMSLLFISYLGWSCSPKEAINFTLKTPAVILSPKCYLSISPWSDECRGFLFSNRLKPTFFVSSISSSGAFCPPHSSAITQLRSCWYFPKVSSVFLDIICI